MKKEFVPWEEAIKLKELGFDEKCIAYFFRDGGLNNYFNKYYINSGLSQTKPFSFSCTAPLYQQAFRWFREKHDKSHRIYETGNNTWCYRILGVGNFSFYSDGDNKNYKTYEEAELECLKKLIEIIKNK